MFFRLYRPILSLLLTATLLLAGTQELWAADAEPAALAEKSLLLDGQAVAGRLVVVGERGHILFSSDAGRSWQQRPVPTRATLTSVFFADGQHGWAAGHDGVILRTNDGGNSWQKVHEDLESGPLLDVWFRDAGSGYAVGAYGLALVTRDGGASWEPLPIVDETGAAIDLHLNQIRALADGRLVIAAEAGQLLVSADGRAWQSLPSPYEGTLFGTLPLDGARLLAFGLRGHLFRSDDGGRSWMPTATGCEASLTDAVRLRDGRVVIVGMAGTVLVGAGDGARFTLHQQADRAGLTRVLEAGDGALVLLGSLGVRRLVPTATGGWQ